MPFNTPALQDLKENLKAGFDRDASVTGLHSLGTPLPGEQTVSSSRRRRYALSQDNIHTVSLVLADGVLRWQDGLSVSTGTRRRGITFPAAAGPVVAQQKFEKLGTSDIPRYLEGLDRYLNPAAYAGSPLRLLTPAGPAPLSTPAAKGKILLIIHGTFSSFDKLLADLQTPAGLQFLARAGQAYQQIISFDHGTLSVGPMLNALDLARFFQNSKADVDVICHSRGGLVTRWWMEIFDKQPRRRRAVLVACPLGGTSLAAPDRIRHALDLLANLGSTLAAGASLIPFLTVAAGLLRIISSMGGLAAKTPLADAILAMIPGLAGQSRIANNLELARLNGGSPGSGPDFFVVSGSYEPQETGLRFWRLFADWKQRLANVAADTLIFPGANDLVVDTASMSELPPGQPLRQVEFAPGEHVDHCSYFRQTKTLDFISQSLNF